MSGVARGDVVRLRGAPEYQQPFTVLVEYQSGTYRLESRQGAPVVSVAPDRLTPIEN